MKLEDLKHLSKDTITYGIGSASNQIILVLMAPLIAAYLTVDLFAIRALTVALYGFLQIIILLSMNQAVIADYYKVKTLKERQVVVSTAFFFCLLTSFAVGGLIFLAATYLPQILDLISYDYSAGFLGLKITEARFIFRLFGIYTAFTPPTFIFLALLQSRKRPLTFSIFSICKSLLRLGLMILFLVILKRELRGLYEADAILSVASFLVVVIFVLAYSRGFKFSFEHFKSMLSYAAPLILTAAFFWGREMLDRFFISLILTQSDLGIYAFARYFPNVVSFLLVTPLNWAWIPYAFSIKDRPELNGLTTRVMTYFLFAAGFLLVVLGGSAQEILQIVAKKEAYWLGAPYVPFLITGIILFAANRIVTTPFHLHRKTKFITLIASISTFIIIGINLSLLPVIGLYASAIAPIVGYGTAIVVSALLVRRLVKIEYEKKRIIIVSAVAITFTAVLFFWHPLTPLLGVLVKIGVGVVGYLGLLAALGFFLPSEWEFIKKRVMRGQSRNREAS